VSRSAIGRRQRVRGDTSEDSIVTCATFEQWLDEGMPATDADRARAHAGQCARCASLLASAIELESRLEAAPAPAPPGFAERVMRRIAEVEARAAAPAEPLATRASHAAPARARVTALPTLPWWGRAAAQPASALAAALAALVVWQEPALRLVASRAATLAALNAPRLVAFPTAPALRPEVELGLALAAAPVLILAAFSLYRWMESLTTGRSRIAH
jgi:hypothetical protein